MQLQPGDSSGHVAFGFGEVGESAGAAGSGFGGVSLVEAELFAV